MEDYWRFGGGFVEVLDEIRILVRVEVLWILYVVCWYSSYY